MSDPRNLVIVGGGFAGITLAEQIEHRLPPGWKLTLVSQENFITYNPLLPEVVGASIMPGHVVAPLRQMIHCSSVCMAQVSEIDLETRTIHYLGEGTGRIAYDQLVLAIGVQSNLHLVKGMAPTRCRSRRWAMRSSCATGSSSGSSRRSCSRIPRRAVGSRASS
jgi:NADH:ubiquinone reductase (H+-translocating)